MALSKTLFSSKTDEWYTPQYLFDELNDEFHFTLDPCASDQNHKCDLYFTRQDDGISKNWGGYSVFCNPPYGRGIGRWVQKASEESKKPNTTVVMLIPARTDTKWFHEYIYGKAEIRFVRGRIRFGGATANAPFPSMIVVFRNAAS